MAMIKSFAMTDRWNNFVDPLGNIATSSDIDALKETVSERLKTIKGELDGDFQGVDYFNIIFAQIPMALKIQELTRVISQTPYVNGVKFVSSSEDKINHSLIVEFEIDSVFGLISFEESLDLSIG